MKSIKEIKNLKGKKVLLRVDFNVPVKNGKVEDDFRIKKSLPTIEYLQKKGAIVILIAHIGDDGSESLEPVVAILKKHFNNISFIKTPALLEETNILLAKAKSGDVILLENIRRETGEKKNDVSFARGLSRLGEIYVNDAFSVSHRAHASIVGLPKYLPSYAGFQLEAEVKNLSKVFENPKHPFLFILGGAKFSTKIPLIKKYLKLADNIFIGGALLNDFLKAKGLEVGQSLVDGTSYGIEKILKNKNLIIPEYVLVKNVLGKFIEKNVKEVSKDDVIIDVGIEATKNLLPIIKKSKMILWNGPLGKYEIGGGGATKEVLKMVAGASAESIIGGGDTVTLISEMKMEKKFSFVSTGGGATLDFLASGTLPGIKALK